MSFQRFNRAEDIVENQRTIVTSGLFSGGNTSITAFYTASTQGVASASYVDIYNEDPTGSAAEIQFSLGFAHVEGSGSIGNSSDTNNGDRQSAAMYRQFRNLLLAPNTDKFSFTGAPAASSSGYDDFYFISIQRSRMREKLNPGNWELRISGSTRTVRLIDDSSGSAASIEQGGRVFNIVSGSIAGGSTSIKTAAASETTDGAPGLFYADLGLLLLNPDWFHANCGAELSGSRQANTFDFTHKKLFNGVVGGEYFQARREEEISSTSYFCRVNNKRFNFSTNPTFFTSSDGSLTQTTFFKDPQTFITQVGLYNDSNELLAIAKLSQPLLNSYAREAIIKVKLDF